MIAEKILNQHIPAIKPDTPLAQALLWMGEYHVQHLALTDEKDIFLGIASEEDILDCLDWEELKAKEVEWTTPRTAVDFNDNLFEIIRRMAQNKLSAIPVTDEQRNYLGLIPQSVVIQRLANKYSLHAKGAFILFAMPVDKYSMVEIAQIIEGSGAKLLASLVDFKIEGEEMNVLVKLNTETIDPILASFERYEYEIVATFNQEDKQQSENDMQERFDSLMNYLNV